MNAGRAPLTGGDRILSRGSKGPRRISSTGAKVFLGERIHSGWTRALSCAAGVRLRTVHAGSDGMSLYISPASDKPNLLLLHGLTGDKSVWLPAARFLAAKFRLVIPDLPAHGDNCFNSNSRYRAVDNAETVCRLLETLAIERTHVAGNSFGGLIAYELAWKGRCNIRSLSLFNPAGSKGSSSSWLDRCIIKGENPFLVDTTTGFRELYRNIMFRPHWLPSPVVHYLARLFAERREIIEALFHDYQATRPPMNAGADFAIPVSVVWGREDRIVHRSASESWKTIVPGAQHAIWLNVGHMPMLEAPRRVAHHIMNFVSAQPLSYQ